MGRAIQQNAQMINMMSQQRASQRQAAQAEQEMELARVEEARKAALHGPAMDKARSEATAAGIKTALDFSNFVYTGLSNSADPAQATQIAQRIGQQPQFQEELFQGALADAMATMPQDPAEFGVWKEDILARTMDGAKRLQRKLIEQTSGDEQRIISVPEYGRGAATEVPGSRIKAPPGITYVKDDAGNIYPMPKTMPGGGFDTPAPSAPAGAGGDTFSRMINVESRGQQFDRSGKPLTSRAGAIGIAQVMPGTAPEAARLAGLPFDENRYRNDPEYNLALGKAYYEKQLADFGDERLAAAAYNAGPGAVRRALQKGGPNGWINHVPRETQKYVRDVFGAAPAGRGSAGTGGAPQPVIKGQPKPPKSTEAERRFGTISRQMRTNLREAVDILTNNPEAVRPSGAEYAASQIPFYGEEAALFAQSEPRQQFVATILRFLDNVTFVNTGAGTSKAQEENYRRSYIPTYQDTPPSSYRKLKSMVEFAQNVKDAAGVLWTPELDADFKALTAAVEQLNPAKKGGRREPAAAPAKRPTRTPGGAIVIDW
jgi:hypothetical protein